MSDLLHNKQLATTSRNLEARHQEQQNHSLRSLHASLEEFKAQDQNFILTIYTVNRDDIPLTVQMENAFDYLLLLRSLNSIHQRLMSTAYLRSLQSLNSFEANVRTFDARSSEGNLFSSRFLIDPENQCIICKSLSSVTEIQFSEVNSLSLSL